MPAFARELQWPVEFVPTEDNSVESYARAAASALHKGDLDYLLPLPEALLFQGLVDRMDQEGLGNRIAGLSQEGAFVEGDKIKCKELCAQASIPVADEWAVVDARSFQEVLGTCLRLIHDHGGAVLKYPYSAGGKGARVVLNTWEVKEVYDVLLQDYKKDYKRMFKNKPWPLLVESRMSGVEISFTILVDGRGSFQVLPTSMDYPERFPGPADKRNPITGGMGSISPHPFESKGLLDLVSEQVARPLISALAERGLLRPCVLYPGCFASFVLDSEHRLQPSTIRVCEVNIRPGEPEFQAVVRRVRNLGPLIRAMFDNTLDQVEPEVREDQISLCFGLVTGPGGPDGQKGYPWSVTKHEPLEWDPQYMQKKNIQVIPSGMGFEPDSGYYSDGTRVAYLNVNGTVKASQSRAEVAEKLRARILNAFHSGRIRVIPREDPSGNRLALREDIGIQFQEAEALTG
jgi:phosphoribosylamine--glycine ligase